jgi:phosphoglycolate phosphatase
MKYRAVLFDLDGTLLDTLQDIADATNEALCQSGFPPHELEAYKYMVGEGRKALARHALPEGYRDAVTVSHMVARIDEEYSRRWVDHTRPYPGISGLLDGLTARNIRMAVLSNKAQDFTGISVSSMLAQWHFDVVIGASESMPLKPDPAAALMIARRLDILPAEFIYLGDSGIDMKTATAAGMYPVGALWGFRPADELLLSGAKTIIKQPAELLGLLG